MIGILNNGFTFDYVGKNWELHTERKYTLVKLISVILALMGLY